MTTTHYKRPREIEYKRVTYDENENPKFEHLFTVDEFLHSKKDFTAPSKVITTVFSKDGQIKYTETKDTKTGEITRKYNKLKC